MDDALTVQTTAESGEEDTGIPGVMMRRFTLSSAIENVTEALTMYHYTRWPHNGEGRRRNVKRVWLVRGCGQ